MSQQSRHGLVGSSQGPTMLQSRCQVGSFPELRVPFQACSVVGRIQFLVAVGLRLPLSSWLSSGAAVNSQRTPTVLCYVTLFQHANFLSINLFSVHHDPLKEMQLLFLLSR